MALSPSEVAKIAHLARLQLSPDEETAVTARLNDILGMIDRLQAADTAGITPMAHPLDATQPLRDDVVTESDRHEAYQAIAPATEAGLYLVPKVIE
ncbi:MAG: Asp-tRNA(Asn)/Glu-tRNA(Gln) amidotransferase subunit GatC [Moraxellaceae bacterium]